MLDTITTLPRMSALLTWSKRMTRPTMRSSSTSSTNTVETIYRNNTCVLKIENKIREIPQTVGVRQGDNMAPVLFLFLMTAFAKTLELVWKERNIPILHVMTTANEHIAEGKICSHTPAMFKSKKLTMYEILQCLYEDDGAFFIQDKGGLAMRDGTHLSPLCKIWVKNAHWTWRLGVEDRMRLLPPSSVLPAPGEDKRRGMHNPMSVQ